MAQSGLHHVQVTLFGEVVGINLTRLSLALVSGTFLCTLWVNEVVRVVLGGHGLGSLQVVECLSHGATFAACGLTRAVEHLLDRQGCQIALALLNGVGTFKGSNSCESPVRAAHALIDNI